MKSFIQKLFNKFGYRISRLHTNLKIPSEADDFQKKIIKECSDLTATGTIRMFGFLKAIEHVCLNDVKGDIVECGVLQGGNIIMAQKYLNKLNSANLIYGFDTFAGMTEPTKEDTDNNNNSQIKIWKKHLRDDKICDWAFCSIEDVNKNISNLVPKNNIKLIKGKVEHTLLIKENIPEKISILRLDTDWYESTKIELEVLYPRLSKGGFLIIDDYGEFSGCRKAVDDFFKNKKHYLNYIDSSSRVLIKP